MDNLSSRRSALAKKSASFEIHKSASSRREVIHVRIFWRVRRWWMFGSLTISGRTLPIPQYPQYCISVFWGNMFSIWCSTCIVRTRVLGVRHWRLQAIGKAPRASMLNTKVSIEWHQQVENWTLFQTQHNFYDVTLKFTVLQRHFHKFCDTPSISLTNGWKSVEIAWDVYFSISGQTFWDEWRDIDLFAEFKISRTYIEV